MIGNAIGVAGGLRISALLGVSGVHANWVGAAYPLTQGTFVLVSGRLGAVYGHKHMLILGGACLTLFTLGSGFCTNFIASNVLRALSGIGGAFIMPNAVAMIAITNPPGKARNLAIGFFAASAPSEGSLGAIITGGFLDRTSFKWLFVFTAAFGMLAFAPLWALLPCEIPVDRHGEIDWLGAFLGTSALIVFNFVWNQAPAVGWSAPYEIALLILSVVLFVAFGIWEHRSPHPIMPLKIFKAPSFLPLFFVVLMNFMATGTVLWYMVVWLQQVRGWSILQFGIGWTPFGICATASAFLSAWLIPRLSAQWILAIGTVSILVPNLLIATMPAQQSYWAQVFPATILMSFCPDLVYTAAQTMASNSVRRRDQSIAGSLIGALQLYGNSLGLGFASTVETEVAKGSKDPIKGYRAALYFGAGIAAVALAIDVFFVRKVKDDREGWEHTEDTDPSDELPASIEAVATGTDLVPVRTSHNT